ncbi:MAG: RNA methyltransferase [bacterium]
MKISIVTVFPELYTQFFTTSILGRAIEKNLIEFNLVRLSDFVKPKERIDEPTCGPGPGMIIKPDVLERALMACEEKWGTGYRIFFSPQGVTLNQNILKDLAQQIAPERKLVFKQDCPQASEFAQDASQGSGENKVSGQKQIEHLVLVCSRYEGIDERVLQKHADLELSIGDYVLFGGDLPAQVLIEGLSRLISHVVGTQESVECESFSGAFLDHPQYGLPVEWHGKNIPEVVLSGNHAKIEQWRKQEACRKTVLNRFDWFRSSQPNKQDVQLATSIIPHHYVAVMHTQVLMKDGSVGQTSVASLDIHDIARSAKAYGFKNFFVVSPLVDQQEILKAFLSFWRSPEGIDYNKSRHDAVELVVLVKKLDEVLENIYKLEGKKPIIIATSAKQTERAAVIDYYSQAIVWKHERPVLFLFGTGWGLCDEVLVQCDYILTPVNGMTDYNHLSVRAAASIIFDRWLGLQPRKRA